MAPSPAQTKRSRRELITGLAIIAAIFTAQAVISVTWTRTSRARARQLSERSLFSIEQVTRIGRDIAGQRVLLDDHILQSHPATMDVIERRIQDLTTDIARAEEAYAPFVALANDRNTWQRAQALIARFDHEVSESLGFSRRNMDSEARATLAALIPDYANLNRLIAELIEVNRAGAAAAMAQIREIDRSTGSILVGNGAVGLLAVLLVGWGGMRRIAAHEELLLRHVRLLEERNRELDAFAGRIAHDLRNPLSSVSMTIDILSRALPGSRSADVERMRRGLKRLDVMIKDLLALSRLDADAGTDTCNPAEVSDQIRQDFVERFGDEASLRHQIDAAHIRCGDGLLRQALWNLVENGVKYRREAVPQVTLVGQVSSGMYELRVSDNGMGMSPEETTRVFDPFYRAQRARDVGGTGLGLAIVKRIVEARGGTVSIESTLQAGSTFIVRLPLSATS